MTHLGTSTGAELLRRGAYFALVSLAPNCYHCFHSSFNDNSVPATGKGAYYLSKAKSPNCCPFLSAFPTHSCILKRKHHFSILCHRHCVSRLGWGLVTGKDAHCPPLSTSTCALLWEPCFAVTGTSKLLSAEPASWMGCLFWVSRFLGVPTLPGFQRQGLRSNLEKLPNIIPTNTSSAGYDCCVGHCWGKWIPWHHQHGNRRGATERHIDAPGSLLPPRGKACKAYRKEGSQPECTRLSGKARLLWSLAPTF